MILLPGSDQQLKFLLNSVDTKDKRILIIGSGTIDIAKKFLTAGSAGILIIVDDYDTLISMRYQLEKAEVDNVEIRLMEFENTDFKPDFFDIVFAQASVSVTRRNKIIKEIRKILKPGEIFCAGEIVNLKENPPAFIRDIWNSSDLLPLLNSNLTKYYEEKGFEVIEQKDLSYTLREFYQQSEKMLHTKSEDLSEEEKSYHKKLLKKISHESNVYLKLGGNTYMGFTALIMRKN
jgi:SAM-dependent methyltransferase